MPVFLAAKGQFGRKNKDLNFNFILLMTIWFLDERFFERRNKWPVEAPGWFLPFEKRIDEDASDARDASDASDSIDVGTFGIPSN